MDVVWKVPECVDPHLQSGVEQKCAGPVFTCKFAIHDIVNETSHLQYQATNQ